ncbi:MAG TPA: MogA/MoaB family molybdenum cofactor biosynthesis protein [Armatimonadota bacterium]|nr:MogA/MoaB family molybdenum cofactor biosynthesis protein [Armatimonadota bacterium]HOM81614.1 MogA/MoaB family molybdenum cofactor biosynthesis protein [Armatimonadota bacterium]HPO72349.1 MogA/MoaB family molybdenum cofactor biosynthesis protein [Armatimonadota bacterium]HPT98440.1 MogA/MoaB family molybdenum cofactor biosynthesis protein [Armatimonadota bacterium]
MIRVGVLVISQRSAQGQVEDEWGKRLRELLPAEEYEVVEYAILPDEVETVRVTLREWAARCDAVLTVGATGLGPRDITPEATRSVLDRECPGIAEAIRARGYSKRPSAILSRGLAGTIGSCLVVNLRGSLEGVEDGVEVLLPIMPQAVEVVRKLAQQH